MKYRMIVADVDGTLIEPNSHRTTKPSNAVIRAVAEAEKMGAIFSIATARSLDWVEGIVKSLNLSSPIILDNGARIYDCMVQKYIFEAYLDTKKASEVFRVMDNSNYQIYVLDKRGRTVYDKKTNNDFTNIVKMMVLHIHPYEAEDLYEVLLGIPDIAITKSVSGINPPRESVHITHKDARKDMALRRITDLLGINKYQVIGIGDSYNDFSLLTSSGLKVAMDNAVPEIKAIADYIAPSYKRDGVAAVLKKFIINAPK